MVMQILLDNKYSNYVAVHCSEVKQLARPAMFLLIWCLVKFE